MWGAVFGDMKPGGLGLAEDILLDFPRKVHPITIGEAYSTRNEDEGSSREGTTGCAFHPILSEDTSSLPRLRGLMLLRFCFFKLSIVALIHIAAVRLSLSK